MVVNVPEVRSGKERNVRKEETKAVHRIKKLRGKDDSIKNNKDLWWGKSQKLKQTPGGGEDEELLPGQ